MRGYPRPDWKRERTILTRHLWECVALSYNINPVGVETDEHFNVAAVKDKAWRRIIESERLDQLIRVVKSHTRPITIVRWSHDAAFITVDLVSFVKWATGPGQWTRMPRQLVTLAKDAPASPQRTSLSGGRRTYLFDALVDADREWWSTYDPEDPGTAPRNDEIADWLIKRKVTRHIAAAIATILRPPELPLGRRAGGKRRIPQHKQSLKK